MRVEQWKRARCMTLAQLRVCLALALVNNFATGVSFSQPKPKELARHSNCFARDRRCSCPYRHIRRPADSSR